MENNFGASTCLREPGPQETVCGPSLPFGPIRPGVSLAICHRSQLCATPCDAAEFALLGSNVAPKRREQFVLGRCAAHLALRKLHHYDASPIGRKFGGAPAWPTPFVGSITHCGDWAIAAVANARDLNSIGIDLEQSSAVAVNEIIDFVTTAREREWVLSAPDTQLRLAAVFSAKEAAYKALFPLCGRFFDFQAIEITPSPERSSFRGTLCEQLSADFGVGYRLEIGCQTSGTFVFTHALIHHPGKTRYVHS